MGPSRALTGPLSSLRSKSCSPVRGPERVTCSRSSWATITGHAVDIGSGSSSLFCTRIALMQYAPGVYDLAVVGASFAGLVAARTAAMRGLKVVVVDLKGEAGHRVATTGILVKEAAEEFDVPHHLTRRVHGVRLYAPNLRHIDLFAPGYFFLTTDTAGLLRWLAQEAERAGARVLWGARFCGGAWDGQVFHFSGLEITTRYILGADGARSTVARHFRLG